MTEPVPSYNNVSWWGNFGEYGFLTKTALRAAARLRSRTLAAVGVQPAQGVETLPQRMDAHLANAKKVVDWLVEDARIAYVNYAGLPGHAHYERAKKLLPWALGLCSPSG